MGKMLELLRKNEAKQRKEFLSAGIVLDKPMKEDVFIVKQNARTMQIQNNFLEKELARLRRQIKEISIRDINNIEVPKCTNPDEAEEAVAELFNLEDSRLLYTVARNDTNLMLAKHVVRFICLECFCMTAVETAARYNKKNHTSILNSKKVIYDMYTTGTMHPKILALINSCSRVQIFNPYDSSM